MLRPLFYKYVNMIKKLIFRNISILQLSAFFISNLVGLFIVLTGIQLFEDVKPIINNGDSFVKQEYIVVSKKVASLNTLTSSPPVFTDREIADIKSQEFVKDLAIFVPSMFYVNASIGSSMMGTTISTDMFFEAIPDKFMDVDLNNWHYDEHDEYLPIVIPRNYLNLYNFGFASSQGLPVISEKIISNIIINFKLYGTKGEMSVNGRIVGLSDRINTILVPIDFLQKTNNILNYNATASTSRIVIEVNNPSDVKISQYLADNNYEVENDATDSAKTKHFLRLLLLVVVLIGLTICALSIYVLMLSIFLLLQKMTYCVDNLLLIGYSTREISKPYCLIGISLNLLSLLLALISVCILRNYYLPHLETLYPFGSSSMQTTIISGLSICIFISIIYIIAISRKVTAIWNIHKK